MKLSTALGILTDLRFAFQVAVLPTLNSILWSPTLLFRPRELSAVFMAHVWQGGFANGTDEGGRPIKQKLITPNAYGVVLDLGAGHGHTTRYLNRARVAQYVALEPNKLMHPHIREMANSAGFHESDGSFVILSCGAEDSATIVSSLSPPNARQPITYAPVDTIISILTLCTIPNPERTLHNLVRDVLKPGGQLLFYEHVLSPRADVAWWQRFWAPVWQLAFDGCRIDRPSHLWVQGLKRESPDGKEEGESVWRETEVWGKEDEPEENLFWHQVGKCLKM